MLFSLLNKVQKIGGLEAGREVTVAGRVEPKQELTVPGTQLRCVGYYVLNEAWQTGARGRGRKMWVPQSAQNKCGGFFVDDGSGRIWVAACDGAQLEILGGFEQSGPLGKKGTGRYGARVVRAGDTVRVRGVAERTRGAEPGDGLAIRPGGRKGLLSIKVTGLAD